MPEYRATWPGYVIRWRPLAWNEHRRISNLPLLPVARYLEAYRQCVIDGPPLAEVPCGIAYFIGRREIEESPFSGNYKPIRQALDQGRKWLQDDYLNVVQAIVAWTFRYTPEEIERWDADKLFKRLAQAEFVFNRPLDPSDPNAAPQTEEDKRKHRPKTARQQEQIDRLQRVMERRRQNAGAGLQ